MDMSITNLHKRCDKMNGIKKSIYLKETLYKRAVAVAKKDRRSFSQLASLAIEKLLNKK